MTTRTTLHRLDADATTYSVVLDGWETSGRVWRRERSWQAEYPGKPYRRFQYRRDAVAWLAAVAAREPFRMPGLLVPQP